MAPERRSPPRLLPTVALLLGFLLCACATGEPEPPAVTGSASEPSPFPTFAPDPRLEELEAAAAAAPDDARIKRDLAAALRRSNKRQEALAHYRRAAELAPDDPRYRLELALALTSVALFDEAEVIYRELATDPRHRPVALNNLGNIELRRERLVPAIDYYRQALELRPDYLLARYHLGEALLQQGKYQEAYDAFQAVLRLTPPDDPAERTVFFDAVYRVGDLELRAGAHERAVEILADLLRVYPEHPNAGFAYGRALLALGRADEARDAFERHMSLPDRTAGRVTWLGSPEAAPQRDRVYFADVTAASGIDYVNVCGKDPRDKDWLTEGMGAGAAWLDYDGDGHLDVYLVNGSDHDRPPGGGEPNRLYRGDGHGHFVEVTAAAGVGDRGWGYGVAVGDYDNDSDPDLYVTNYKSDVLYRNEGNGTFTDVTERAGLGDAEWSTAAAFFDGDADGDLDLYVGNYLELDPTRVPRPGESEICMFKGVDVPCGPKPLTPSQDVYWRNEGDGTFTDATRAAGFHLATPRYTLGVVTGDYDNDGDTDLYVANDSVPNSLWQNRGDGTFEDVGVLTLSAVTGEGRPQAGMGTDFGDWTGDGWLDIVVTNFSHDLKRVYRNVEGRYFVDESSAVGLGVTSMMLSWGTGFHDFDNDGDLDLFIANGHLYPEMDDYDLGTHYRQPNHVFVNDDGGRLIESSAFAGPGFAVVRSFRGAAFADYDDDGDVDMLVTAIDDRALLLENRSPAGGHFLEVRLIGTRSNRDGVGARVTVVAGGRRMVRERRGGGSYLSQHDPRLHFGLGGTTRVDRVEVRWPSGVIDVLSGLEADRTHTVTEGAGG